MAKNDENVVLETAWPALCPLAFTALGILSKWFKIIARYMRNTLVPFMSLAKRKTTGPA